MYDEGCVVEYNWDLWAKSKGAIRVFTFCGQQSELVIAANFSGRIGATLYMSEAMLTTLRME